MPSSVSLEPKLGLDFHDDSSSLSEEQSDEASRPNSVEKNDHSKVGISDKVEEELSRLWDSGQEWILIFDNLLKHPGGKVSKGCKCDMCEMQKFTIGNSAEKSTQAKSEISGNSSKLLQGSN